MKTIKGDLIKLAEEGKFNMIVHGANCFHTMKSGIAGQLAKKYPQVLEADRENSIHGDREKLGSWSECAIDTDTRMQRFVVINAYTQYTFSREKDVFEYDAFQKFLNTFSKYARKYTLSYWRRLHIGFPMIGAGLAGGDWNRISKMIEKFAEDVKDYADVTVVEYQP